MSGFLNGLLGGAGAAFKGSDFKGGQGLLGSFAPQLGLAGMAMQKLGLNPQAAMMGGLGGAGAMKLFGQKPTPWDEGQPQTAPAQDEEVGAPAPAAPPMDQGSILPQVNLINPGGAAPQMDPAMQAWMQRRRMGAMR